jgi:hypothetical protein
MGSKEVEEEDDEGPPPGWQSIPPPSSQPPPAPPSGESLPISSVTLYHDFWFHKIYVRVISSFNEFFTLLKATHLVIHFNLLCQLRFSIVVLNNQLGHHQYSRWLTNTKCCYFLRNCYMELPTKIGSCYLRTL